MSDEMSLAEQITLTQNEEIILEKVLNKLDKIITEKSLRKNSEIIKKRNYHFPIIDNSFYGIFNDNSKQNIKLGFLLQYQFNRHKNVMLTAVNFDERALLFINSKLLENDIEFAKNLIRITPNAFVIAGKLQSDKDFCIFAIENGCHYAMYKFLEDEQVLEIAIKTDPIAMLSVPEKLRKNVDFMVKMIAKYPKCIDYFTEKEGSYINLLSDCFYPGLFFDIKRTKCRAISPIKWLFDIFEDEKLTHRLPADMKKIFEARLKQAKSKEERDFYSNRYKDLVKSFNTSYIRFKRMQEIQSYSRETPCPTYKNHNDLTEGKNL